MRARAQWRASSPITLGECVRRLDMDRVHAFTDAPYEASLSKPLEKQPAGRAKLSTPCQREEKEKRKKKTTHIHSQRSPSSNPLSLPIYPRHHPGSAPPLFFLSASLIIRQTHLFPINKPLSLRAGEEGMEECSGGGSGNRSDTEGGKREINTRLSWRVEVIKKTKNREQKLGRWSDESSSWIQFRQE